MLQMFQSYVHSFWTWVLFVVGSVMLARPFAKHWLTLLVAVPIAALCGALVLGVAVLLITLVVFLLSDGGDFSFDFGGGGGGSTRKKDDKPEDPEY